MKALLAVFRDSSFRDLRNSARRVRRHQLPNSSRQFGRFLTARRCLSERGTPSLPRAAAGSGPPPPEPAVPPAATETRSLAGRAGWAPAPSPPNRPFTAEDTSDPPMTRTQTNQLPPIPDPRFRGGTQTAGFPGHRGPGNH